jgi:hypothetical protein
VTEEEARGQVIDEWKRWAKSQGIGAKGTNVDAMQFHFDHLHKERPHLLAFTSSGNKWQIVQSWLSDAGLISL